MIPHTAALLAAAAILGLTAGCDGPRQVAELDTEAAQRAAHPALLYGTVTTAGGETYRGRLRFGGDEEAFWGDYFNGRKDTNPWVAHMPEDERPRHGINLIALHIGRDTDRIVRPFMARLGDIAKLEARGRHLWVTMKSGTVHHLDRYAADDYADGIRVWDAKHGVVDLDERSVRTIEFEAAPERGQDAPGRLYGEVRTREGVFTGFIHWGRRGGGLATDDLVGQTVTGEDVGMPFGTVRSIVRTSPESARVTLVDGRQLVLSDSRHVGAGNRGIFVDDARYGRVLVSWDALERADFTVVGTTPGDSGPSYDDYPPGRPLAGIVTTRTGRNLEGRIVFDMDESETTATLDAPVHGVDYTLPFDRVRSIVLHSDDRPTGPVDVVLHTGEQLRLEPAGDLRPDNGGLLIFTGSGERAEYVPWGDVARIDFRTPPAR